MMSLSINEQTVMDAFDRGVPPNAIPRQVGLPAAYVRRVLGYLQDGGEEGQARRAAERGSAMMVAAIAATGRDYR